MLISLYTYYLTHQVIKYFALYYWELNLDTMNCDNIFKKPLHNILNSGVLISGGYDYGRRAALRSAEIYTPATNTTCSLPPLPGVRYGHTQNGGLACGGTGSSHSSKTCDLWSSESGSWTRSHTLRQSRYHHVSWATEDGVYLMGGTSGSCRTTELVKEDGSVEDGFTLKYSTR